MASLIRLPRLLRSMHSLQWVELRQLWLSLLYDLILDLPFMVLGLPLIAMLSLPSALKVHKCSSRWEKWELLNSVLSNRLRSFAFLIFSGFCVFLIFVLVVSLFRVPELLSAFPSSCRCCSSFCIRNERAAVPEEDQMNPSSETLAADADLSWQMKVLVVARMLTRSNVHQWVSRRAWLFKGREGYAFLDKEPLTIAPRSKAEQRYQRFAAVARRKRLQKEAKDEFQGESCDTAFDAAPVAHRTRASNGASFTSTSPIASFVSPLSTPSFSEPSSAPLSLLSYVPLPVSQEEKQISLCSKPSLWSPPPQIPKSGSKRKKMTSDCHLPSATQMVDEDDSRATTAGESSHP